MTMMPDAHVGTGAYVLDALPADERLGFEEHLTDCTACQAEVAELSEAVARLGATVATDPPAGLKERVMAAIGNVRQLPPLSPEERRSSEVEDRRRSRRNFFALAAGVLAVAGAGGIAVDQYRDARGLRRDRDRIAAVLNESDARTVRGAVQGGGRATVVSSRRRDEAVVVVAGLPAAPAGREYQLWFIESQTHARSLGLLGRTPGTDTLLVSGNIAASLAFGITVEPEGGSPEPSTTPIAALPMTT